ncbi:MAG: glycosyltransferase family 4 protein [Nitrospirae bacterium]|nr:glycosyltransferase family 4 protein [Nitrospirota bacterium]
MENNKMKVSLLTGGMDPHYALSLMSGLITRELHIDFIGNDEMQKSEFVKNANVNYFNLRGDQNSQVSLREKMLRVIRYYLKLLKYAAFADSKLFHILWLNKLMFFDSILLNTYYKLLGKKIVFTAHNVNAGERDDNDSLINRFSLRFLYKIVDHIFVHTERMKLQVVEDFNIEKNKVTVIPFGINKYTPKTSLSTEQARIRLQIRKDEKVILFLGNIAPYKGLEFLISALARLKERNYETKLLIAGRIKNCESYWKSIMQLIKENNLEDCIISKVEYIPEEDIEMYLKSADVLILPYKHIFQSGVLFLAYNFGLPVIATDVGSLREDIIEGKTGFICKPEDPQDLAEKIEMYFQSDLYKNLETNRQNIIEYANEKYSWEKIGEKTMEVYKELLIG